MRSNWRSFDTLSEPMKPFLASNHMKRNPKLPQKWFGTFWRLSFWTLLLYFTLNTRFWSKLREIKKKETIFNKRTKMQRIKAEKYLTFLSKTTFHGTPDHTCFFHPLILMQGSILSLRITASAANNSSDSVSFEYWFFINFSTLLIKPCRNKYNSYEI